MKPMLFFVVWEGEIVSPVFTEWVQALEWKVEHNFNPFLKVVGTVDYDL